MFSEYTSKFLTQSQVHSAKASAPLFYSTNEYGEEEEEGPSPSLYSTRRATNWVSSFASRSRPRNPALSDDDEDETPALHPIDSSTSTIHSSQPHGALSSVRLSEPSNDDDEPPMDIAVEDSHESPKQGDEEASKPFIPIDLFPRDEEAAIGEGYVPPEVGFPTSEAARFDSAWGNAFLLCVSMFFATSGLIWLRTSAPKSIPLGDTVYTVLKASGPTLTATVLFSAAVSVAWVLVMRRYATALVYTMIISVPVGLISLSVYPTVMSYRTPDGGYGSQDRAMRWFSFLPLILACVWVFALYKGRHVLDRSLGVVKLACAMVSENRTLLLLGAASVAVFLAFSVVWTTLFTRVFLEGHIMGGKRWVLDPISWFFGSVFFLVYLWTWGVISGITRATVSAAISQWYFHRHEFPQTSTADVVKAGLQYATSVQFGTICLSSLICLLARLPLIVLPRRLVSLVQIAVYNLVSAPALSLTDPLTLTNAVINSQPLLDSARSVSALRFVGPKSPQRSSAWTAYRLSKLILSAGRWLTAFTVGLASWVHAARYTNGGSLYGYVVGLLAAFIGWFVLGATEGTLSMVVDAAFVCFSLDNSNGSPGGHCTEADRQFGS
ncbi:hypothetical protein TRVA0_046S00936 [Trichomonascus vanleenenianus]|uniref:choline transporter-like family protein n=1 Tax=Trichomonascus vanleenenianus TaxID=2268995 RepID=UPI003ECA4235